MRLPFGTRGGLGDDPDSKTLLDEVFVAVETCNPEREAVVIDSRPEGIDVLVIWDGGTWIVGELVWSREQ